MRPAACKSLTDHRARRRTTAERKRERALRSLTLSGVLQRPERGDNLSAKCLWTMNVIRPLSKSTHSGQGGEVIAQPLHWGKNTVIEWVWRPSVLSMRISPKGKRKRNRRPSIIG